MQGENGPYACLLLAFHRAHARHPHTHTLSLSPLTREAKRFSSNFFCRLSSDPPCARLLAVRFRVPVVIAPTDTFTAVVAVVVVVVVVAVVSVVVLEAQAGKEELKEWAKPWLSPLCSSSSSSWLRMDEVPEPRSLMLFDREGGSGLGK